MAHLPSPEEAGDSFSTELSPTVHELRRLLAVKLGASSWHKVSGKLQREDYQREHSDWEHRANAEYRTAVAKLSGAIKIAFPACVDSKDWQLLPEHTRVCSGLLPSTLRDIQQTQRLNRARRQRKST